MKKMALFLMTGLIFCFAWPVHVQADFDGMIEKTRTLLSIFEIHNTEITEALDFVSGAKGQSPETYVECEACKALMEEGRALISRCQNLLSQMEKIAKDARSRRALSAEEKEKIKKEAGAKMDELSQKIAKISAIHLNVIKFLDKKLDFLLEKLEKGKRTPV